MTYRSIAAIIFAVIVAVEVYFYLNIETETTFVPGQRIGNTSFTSSGKNVVDYDSKKSTDTKYTIIIGATILVGGIVTFAFPNKPLKAEGKEIE